MHKAANILLSSLITIFLTSNLSAQDVLFDFDSAPLYTSLPIDQTVSGITAHLSASGQGYSIQDANVLGFTPPGFAGHIIYPNSIYLADLIIRFDQVITQFSIMYSCQELGCDDAATMRVTAYMNGSFVGTDTKTASNPGTWPVDTLSCSFAQGFDSVVVHYDSPPPTCQDYGVIYIADNMRVTPYTINTISEVKLPGMFTLRQNYPNPFNPSTTIEFSLPENVKNVRVSIYNILGQKVAELVNGSMPAGRYHYQWNAKDLASGIYIYELRTEKFVSVKKMVVLK